MSECRQIAECAFYHDRLLDMPETAEFMKVFFCHQRSEYCLRLKNSIAAPVEGLDNATAPVSRKYSLSAQT